MNLHVSIVIVANLLLIGALPRLFFRADGRFNLMWWVTGAPYFITGFALIAGIAGASWAQPLATAEPAWLLPAIASILVLASVGLIGFTLGTHRVPLALWHQDNDAPVEIVTWGAYKRIRHPFYTSFMLTQIAGVLAMPHAVTIAALVYAVAIMTVTARREERNLAASEFGAEYQTYMANTGRFVPSFGRGQ